MKEYICKEDMRKAITDIISECQGSYDAVKRQHEIIDEMLKLPTVTKADILFDFKNDISDAIDRHNVVLLNEVNAIYRKHREVVDGE